MEENNKKTKKTKKREKKSPVSSVVQNKKELKAKEPVKKKLSSSAKKAIIRNKTRNFSSKDIDTELENIQSEYLKLQEDLKDFKSGYSDRETIDQLQKYLQDIQHCLPTAKNAFLTKPQQGTAYAYSALMNLSREIMNDIRSIESLEQQVEHINSTIISDCFRNILQIIVSENGMLRESTLSLLKDSQSRNYFDNFYTQFLRAIATSLTERQEDLKIRIKEFLLEPEDYSKRRKKRK